MEPQNDWTWSLPQSRLGSGDSVSSVQLRWRRQSLMAENLNKKLGEEVRWMWTFNGLRMLFGSGLTLLLCSIFAHVSSQSCRCKALPLQGLRVNCSSQGLRSVPHLPAEVTELLLQNNLLTTVTPGHLDQLHHLQLVNFSGNTFHCDCSIQYLRQWLQRNKAVSVMPVCSSPAELAQRSIHELTDAVFASCVSDHCFGWVYNAILCIMLCFLIGLLLWCMQLARNSTFILGIDERHTGFEAESLRSLKPKHRARMRCSIGSLSPGTDDMDKPLLNMDILPQILDVLNKQHNIKIKVP